MSRYNLTDNEISMLLHRINELETALKPFADYIRGTNPRGLTAEDWKQVEEAMPNKEGLSLDDILSKIP